MSFFPSSEDIDRIRGWMKFKIGQVIAQHHPAFSQCGKFIQYEICFSIWFNQWPFIYSRHPAVSFPTSKKSKSEVSIVSLSVEDPSSHDGMIKVSEKLIPYLPKLPNERNQKTVLFGDQLYIERGKFSQLYFAAQLKRNPPYDILKVQTKQQKNTKNQLSGTLRSWLKAMHGEDEDQTKGFVYNGHLRLFEFGTKPDEKQ